MTQRMGAIVVATACALSAACARDRDGSPTAAQASAADVLTVYTVNYPLQYFAERIGGERVEVRFPAPADEDPAYWKPDAETIVDYQRADLILANGAGYADWIAKVTLPLSAIVDTSADFADRYIPLEDVVTHTHGPAGDHEHGGLAFTTWLDPTLAIEQAQAIADALVRKLPEHEAELRQRFAALEADLASLDERLAGAAAAIGNRPLVFSHPVYQYLERRYALRGRSLHWEPEEAPKIAELRRLLDEHPARWLIWEGPPTDGTVRELERIGLASVVFAPCASDPQSGDFLTAMNANAVALERIAAASAR